MYDAGVKEPAESSFDPQPGGRKSAGTHRSTLKPQSPAPQCHISNTATTNPSQMVQIYGPMGGDSRSNHHRSIKILKYRSHDKTQSS